MFLGHFQFSLHGPEMTRYNGKENRSRALPLIASVCSSTIHPSIHCLSSTTHEHTHTHTHTHTHVTAATAESQPMRGTERNPGDETDPSVSVSVTASPGDPLPSEPSRRRPAAAKKSTQAKLIPSLLRRPLRVSICFLLLDIYCTFQPCCAVFSEGRVRESKCGMIFPPVASAIPRL